MVIRPSLLVLPQEYVMDVYLSVRLEAGTLHLANYLIRITVYYLGSKGSINYLNHKPEVDQILNLVAQCV